MSMACPWSIYHSAWLTAIEREIGGTYERRLEHFLTARHDDLGHPVVLRFAARPGVWQENEEEKAKHLLVFRPGFRHYGILLSLLLNRNKKALGLTKGDFFYLRK